MESSRNTGCSAGTQSQCNGLCLGRGRPGHFGVRAGSPDGHQLRRSWGEPDHPSGGRSTQMLCLIYEVIVQQTSFFFNTPSNLLYKVQKYYQQNMLKVSWVKILVLPKKAPYDSDMSLYITWLYWKHVCYAILYSIFVSSLWLIGLVFFMKLSEKIREEMSLQ